MSKSKLHRFPGNAVTVHWDGRLCIHVAECGKSAGELFVGGRDPWCVPDKADASEVADVCARCPSGALSASAADGTLLEQAPPQNRVQVTYNGPLYLHGELAFDGAAQDSPGVRYRAALCRCGRSANKPFCDNNHLQAGFQDAGAIGDSGPGVDDASGPLSIKPLDDGPLLLTGGVVLIAGSGRVAWRGDKVALCRCGESNNKPFCDGSHSKVGFKSD